MKVLLHLSFLGTNYCGYQIQPNGVTVQQRLNEATYALFGHDCDIVGCSRTDSGVHANHFCVAVTKKGTNEIFTDVIEELSKDGFFDLSDSQCEEMMTDRCMGTFKSMYQWVYGRKFKSQDKKP